MHPDTILEIICITLVLFGAFQLGYGFGMRKAAKMLKEIIDEK